MIATAERLAKYGSFSDEVVGAVTEAAAWQNSLSMPELSAHYDTQGGPVTVRSEGRKLEYLDIQPKKPSSSYNPAAAIVCHVAIGSDIRDKQAIQGFRLAGTFPEQRVIMIGNAAFLKSRAGTLALSDHGVVAAGDFTPAVRPTVSQLHALDITETVHAGCSYGATKALASAALGTNYDQTTRTVSVFDPVTAEDRSVFELTKAFMNTGAKQMEYVRDTDSRAYHEFWDDNNPLIAATWMAGLVLRSSNIAVTLGLRHGKLENMSRGALESQPDMKLRVNWGRYSEIVATQPIRNAVDRLQTEFGSNRVRGTSYDVHHAASDNLDFYAATIAQDLLVA